MNDAPRTLVKLAAGVVLLMAATLAADVVVSNSAIDVVGPPTSWTGEVVRSEMTGAYPVAAAIRGYAPITGTAVFGSGAGGVGVYGTSTSNAGVYGTSNTGDGGHFTSSGGYGVYAYSSGPNHWHHGVYASANQGYGVYGKSTNNDGVRGEGKNAGVRGISTVSGVSGDGDSYGVFGNSFSGYGVYGGSSLGYGVRGTSDNSYAGHFYSSNYRGLYAQSGSSWWDARFGGTLGIYVVADIVAGGSKAGYVADLARNAGSDPLRLGDVVVITGATAPVLGEIPVATVRLADEAGSSGVMGVVDRMFATPADIASIPAELTDAWRELSASMSAGEPAEDAPVAAEDRPAAAQQKQNRRDLEAESPGRFVSQVEAEFLAKAAGGEPGIAPGAYVGVVTLGAFKAIRVDASYGAVLPGDLLVTSPTPGHAMRARDPRPGTVIGKALGSLEEGQGTIPVLITLQ